MKRRFATKLILSGAALAVSAATLVSTTYAWYVQNSQVTASNITGGVADDDASSIFISKNYFAAATAADATWNALAVFDATDPTAVSSTSDFVANYAAYSASPAGKNYKGTWDGTLNANAGGWVASLDPVTRTATKRYFLDVNQKQTGVYTDTTPTTYSYEELIDYAGSDPAVQAKQAEVVAVKTAAEGKRIIFNLYVKANTNNTTVQPVLRISNSTATKKAQTAYRDILGKANASANARSTIVTKGQKFWTDAVQALRMSVTSKSETTAGGKDWGDSTVKYYDVMKVAKNHDLNDGAYVPYNPVSTLDGAIVLTEAANFTDNDATLISESLTYKDKTGASTTSALIGAHAYFAGLVGAEPKAGFDEAASASLETGSEIATVTLSAEKVTMFTFELWLEGTDFSCFDCCVGQTFNIEVDFKVTA